jgi:hypothetical protein
MYHIGLCHTFIHHLVLKKYCVSSRCYNEIRNFNIKIQTTFEVFCAEAPQLNPKRSLITGLIYGVRIEEIKEPLMREIRHLDKLVDEIAKGRLMEKILRD